MSMHYCLGLTVAVTLWMGAKPAPVGYLARVGPAPLRFQAPAPPPEELLPLPPLAMSDPPPPPPEDFGPPASLAPATPAVETTAPAPAPVVQVVPIVDPAATLSPQMLIQYFNEKNGTNRDYNVVVPFQFTPPPTTSIPAPPSRAIYRVQ